MSRAPSVVRKAAKWLGIGTLSLVAAIAIAGNIYRIQGRAKLHNELQPPGRIVDIGTHRMHIHCVGSGQPTVILDSGGGGYSNAWKDVMLGAASITRTCAFDRSGMGWSERSPGPVDAASRSADLEALLAEAEEPAPYIFAGWSMGGALAWLYAQDHLHQAAGLIMVDSMPPNMDEIAALRGGHPDAPPLVIGLDRLGLLPATMRLLNSSSALFEPSLDPFLSVGIVDELESIPGIGRAAWGMGDLGDLPLIVITHGRPGYLMALWGDRMDEAEDMFQQAQRDMARQSSSSKLVIAEHSDHDVPMDQPEIVVDAIGELTKRYREMQALETR